MADSPYPTRPSSLGDIGSGGAFTLISQSLSNAHGAAERNRASQMAAELAQEQNRLNQQDAFQRAQLAKAQEDRASLTDAAKKLAVSEYRANAQPYTPPTFTSNVAGVKPFTPATPANLGTPGPMSDFERAGTAGLQQEIMKRLGGQSTVPVMPPNPYDNPYTIPSKLPDRRSVWEKIGSFF